MTTVKILGCTVQVKSQARGNDVAYTVSGDGAARLHKVCTDFGCHPTDIKDDAFTVTKSGLSDFLHLGDTPTVEAIRRGLDSASRGPQR